MHIEFLTYCNLVIGKAGLWECSQCGWICKHKFDEPPRRNCPKSPDINSPEHRKRIKQKMLAELQPIIDRSDVPQCDLATITTQLDQCLTPCQEFNGRTCTLRGSGCKKRQRWKEFLALTGLPCRHFEVSPEQPSRSA